ncbi:MAG: HyaD/HybD family hydrogenase maturation endopeptidase [Acidobacteriaceae bacterium]
MRTPHIAIVGLGNLMRTDDALGMLAIERLKMDFQLPESVTMIEGGTLGLELMQPLENVTHLLALDAIDAGETPGTLLRFAGDQIANMPASKSVHLLGFSDLIGAMTLTGDAPEEIVVLGIQPELIAWGTRLSPTVEAALPRLIEAALQQVSQWTRETADTAVPCAAS